MPYLINGTEVEILERTAAGAIVQPVYERENGEIVLGEKRLFTGEVYDVPPTEKRSEIIDTLEKKIAALRVEEAELSRQERTAADRVKKLASYPSLELLEDFLEGRITHFLIVRWSSMVIVEVANAKCDSDRNSRDLKLLTLFGSKERHLTWRLNSYSDGSGTNELCFPCTSREQAVVKLQSFVDAELAQERPQHGLENIVRAADAYGLTIPDETRERVRKNKIDLAKSKVAQLREDLRKAESALLVVESDKSPATLEQCLNT